MLRVETPRIMTRRTIRIKLVLAISCCFETDRVAICGHRQGGLRILAQRRKDLPLPPAAVAVAVAAAAAVQNHGR